MSICRFCNEHIYRDDIEIKYSTRHYAHPDCFLDVGNKGGNTMYNIVRFYENASIRRRIIVARVTLEEAQAHCQDPETSARTCTSATGRARTKRMGFWSDGYEER